MTPAFLCIKALFIEQGINFGVISVHYNIRLASMFDKLSHLICTDRLTVKIALAKITLTCFEKVYMFGGFNAFCYDLEIKAMSHRNGCGDQITVGFAGAKFAHETLVYFEDVERIFTQVTQ